MIASRRWLLAVPRPGLVPLNRLSYRLATCVLANSAMVAKFLMEKDRVPLHKIIEIPNFVEARAFHRVCQDEACREAARVGICDGGFVAGMVARLVPVKNQEMLLRAAQVLDARRSVVLIGDGPILPALQALAHSLGIHARVHFIGQSLSTINLHQYFDASVVCSRSEGFPNSLIEALAAQCPVVATPVGGVTEIIVDNESGFLVPFDDSDALADCLDALRKTPELGSRVAKTGLLRVREKYRQTVVIGQLTELYQKLAARRVAARFSHALSRLAVQMPLYCRRRVFRRDLRAGLYVADTPIIDLPEKVDDLCHLAALLRHCFPMHFEE